MRRSRQLFLFVSAVFFISLIIVGIDISSKTSFPGSKKLIEESIAPGDSTEIEQTKVK